MFRKSYCMLLCIVLCCCAQVAVAADNLVTIVAEGEYVMGDGETMAVCEQRAFDNARRAAIEQAGVYVESYSVTNKLQLTKDEVNVISSGLVQATVVDKKRTIESNGAVRLWCKVKCVIQMDSINDMKTRLGDKKIVDQYHDLQESKNSLDKEIADLRIQLQQAKDDAARQKAEEEIANAEHKLDIQNMMEGAYNMYSNGDNDGAIAVYSVISTLENNSNPEVFNSRGDVYSSKGQYDKALEDYSRAIQLNSQYATPYTNRGQAYMALEQYDKAIADYDEAITLDSENSYYYSLRAAAYNASERYDEAIADYTTAIKRDTESAYNFYLRGRIYYDLGETNKALTDFSSAISLQESYAEAYYFRGLCYSDLGQNTSAVSDWNKVKELDPELYASLPEELQNMVGK